MKSKFLFCILLLLMGALFFSVPALAQCPMCKASAETSLKEGSTYALGINKGILYLLSFPYMLCSIIFLMWYRHYRKSVTSVKANLR